MPVQTVIKLRRDTAANWDTTNPTLAAGEMGIETDTGLHKFGDGTTAWGALPYASTSKVAQQVKNTTGSSIPKGSVVYISGATGGDALITLADADTEATSSKTLGLTATAIANDAYGMVIEQGLITGVNTASATAGQSVWLSSTAGEFVFGTPPAKPAHNVYLGVVLRAHATEGEILVKVQNGYEVNELHDVNITGTLADNEVLAWDDASQMWINQTAAEAGLAIASHTHPIGDITTITIDGTPADNEVLAYDTATSKWINQTASEAGLATTGDVNAKMTNPMTTAGDLIVGGASGTPGRLAIGSTGTVLTSNGTTATWGAAPSGLPSQTGNAGELLVTDGTNASWSNTVTANSVSTSALIAKGLSGQTAAIQRWVDSSDTLLASISQNGRLTVISKDPGTRVITAQAASGQTDNIQDWLNSSGTPLASIGPTGLLTATPAPGTSTTAATGVGYMGIPSSSQSTSASITLTAADAGETIYSTATRTVTIPAGLPVGTTFVFVSGNTFTTTININTDTLRLAGTTTSGSGRTLASNGMATAVKVDSSTWYISGNGLS